MGESTYDKQKTGGKQFAIGDFKLPVAWVEETYKKYETVQKERTEEEAKREIEQILKQKANEIVEGEIENIDIVYQKQEDSIVAIATITAVMRRNYEPNRKKDANRTSIYWYNIWTI